MIIALRDATAEVSTEAAAALGVLRDERAVPALMEVANNPTGYYVWMSRLAAIRALGRFAVNSQARQAHQQIAISETEDRQLRDAAIQALE